jgi:hypothetical protein
MLRLRRLRLGLRELFALAGRERLQMRWCRCRHAHDAIRAIGTEDDYEGLMETVHLLESPANAMRLLRSIKEADEGKLTERKNVR